MTTSPTLPVTGRGGPTDIREPAGDVRQALPTAARFRSGLYEGVVTHHRFEPVDHQFAYRITMTYLDLAEVDRVCRLHPLWSTERANAVSFRRSD